MSNLFIGAIGALYLAACISALIEGNYMKAGLMLTYGISCGFVMNMN